MSVHTHHASGTTLSASLVALVSVSTVEGLPAITQQTVAPEDLATTVPEHAPSLRRRQALAARDEAPCRGEDEEYLDVVKTFAVRSKDKQVDVVRTVKASITRDVQSHVKE